MRCYTYDNHTLTAGCIISGTNQKTCSFNLSIPEDWDVDRLQQLLKSEAVSDTLLHGVARLSVGDSVSSVFPQGCITIKCTDVIYINNVHNSCLEVVADDSETVYVLFDGSCLHDGKTNKYIINHNGELTVSDKPTDYLSELDNTTGLFPDMELLL